MKNQEREDFFDVLLKEAKQVRETKGYDYSGLEDVNRNFKEGAKRLGMTPEQILGVYLDKHLDSIHTFIKDGDVKSEPIRTRIVDAINYLLILPTLKM
jgi:hypothetical protein